MRTDTPSVKSFTLRPDDWTPFRAGQHYDIRLTAPDGYQAQRSYSIASAPEQEGTLEFTIELMPGGEVSPYFHEVVRPGDRIELRGPIGGPFTWRADMGGPLLLIGGGSGVVPLMSMLRHRKLSSEPVRAALIYSARTAADLIYREELDGVASSDHSFSYLPTLTRGTPEGWKGASRRIDPDMVAGAVSRLGGEPLVYCCGSDGFVEAATRLAVEAGVRPELVRAERFGPTGG